MTQPTIQHTRGQPVIVIPPQFEVVPQKIPCTWEKGALKTKEAAAYLGIGLTQLWKLTQTGKIRKTSYGTYAVCELDRHLRAEVDL